MGAAPMGSARHPWMHLARLSMLRYTVYDKQPGAVSLF